MTVIEEKNVDITDFDGRERNEEIGDKMSRELEENEGNFESIITNNN